MTTPFSSMSSITRGCQCCPALSISMTLHGTRSRYTVRNDSGSERIIQGKHTHTHTHTRERERERERNRETERDTGRTAGDRDKGSQRGRDERQETRDTAQIDRALVDRTGKLGDRSHLLSSTRSSKGCSAGRNFGKKNSCAGRTCRRQSGPRMPACRVAVPEVAPHHTWRVVAIFFVTPFRLIRGLVVVLRSIEPAHAAESEEERCHKHRRQRAGGAHSCGRWRGRALCSGRSRSSTKRPHNTSGATQLISGTQHS